MRVVRSRDVPVSAPLVDDAVVVTFVARAGSWTATKGITAPHVLLLDVLHHVVLQRAPAAVGRGRRAGGPVGLALAAAVGAAAAGRLGGRGHGSVERGQIAHHLLVLVEFVGVDGLGMLAEIVKARELLAAVASERPLARMFPATYALAQGTNRRLECGRT